MKATLFLVAFAAVAAAAPSNGAAGNRCGGGSGVACASGETCVGEFQFKDDPKGLCIKKPFTCGATMADPNTTCPKDKKYKCIPRANTMQCPQDVAYCGFCVEQGITAKLGIRSEGVNRCGGSSGKKCFNNPRNPELCAGEKELKDGMGVCIEWGYTRQCKDGCIPGDVCVKNTCPSGLSAEDCSGSVCLDKKYVAQFGLKGRQ
ncbi:hypothetical protein AA313_de0202697 [Arthrobotrys entomopaga]|nr:hypothetical protein AA313_de0202697 [Arthrobotrys entomopaga]